MTLHDHPLGRFAATSCFCSDLRRDNTAATFSTENRDALLTAIAKARAWVEDQSMRDAVLDTQDLCARARSTVQVSQELLQQVDDLRRSNMGPVLRKNKYDV